MEYLPACGEGIVVGVAANGIWLTIHCWVVNKSVGLMRRSQGARISYPGLAGHPSLRWGGAYGFPRPARFQTTNLFTFSRSGA
jgi:hypothetical protein